MPVPDFSVGEVFTAAAADRIGLWLIDSGTKSGATTHTFDNVFTSTYRNYRIVFSGIELSEANRLVRWQFRDGTSTYNQSQYNFAYVGLRAGGGGGNTNAQNQQFAEIGHYQSGVANQALGSVSMDIYEPTSAIRTYANVHAQGYDGGDWQWRIGGFMCDTATTFEGFILSLNGTGNIKLNYAIYGYRN